MIILQPIATAQTIKFIARGDEATHLILRDEQDNTEVQIDAFFIVNGQYLSTDAIFTLKEGRFYNLTVYNDTNIVYKDKVFCTSQTDYSINNTNYIQHETNNDYITL